MVKNSKSDSDKKNKEVPIKVKKNCHHEKATPVKKDHHLSRQRFYGNIDRQVRRANYCEKR